VNSAQKQKKITLNQLKMLYFIPMLKDQKRNNCNFIHYSLALWEVDLHKLTQGVKHRTF